MLILGCDFILERVVGELVFCFVYVMIFLFVKGILLFLVVEEGIWRNGKVLFGEVWLVEGM